MSLPTRDWKRFVVRPSRTVVILVRRLLRSYKPEDNARYQPDFDSEQDQERGFKTGRLVVWLRCQKARHLLAMPGASKETW
jgi:hypothetical protein